jgi:hypothetical protein
MLGIRRIESSVDGATIYRLEDRHGRVEGSIKMNKFLVHIGKTDNSDQIHNRWLASLLNGTIIIYSVNYLGLSFFFPFWVFIG